MYYLLIAAVIWGLSGCSGDGKGAPTDGGDNTQASATFADSMLEAAVRQALRQPTGALRSSTLAGLSSLEARGRGIASLTGIGLLQNLVTLDLADNRIEDLAPLASLTKLKFLDLDNNQVSDLSPLSGLSQLESLILDRNSIKDLTPLLGLTRLRNVELSGNPLSPRATDEQLVALRSRKVEVSYRVEMGIPEIPPTAEEPRLDSEFSLAFVSGAGGGQGDILLLNTETGSLANLTGKPEKYTDLAWSPGGEKLAFISDYDPGIIGNHLFVMGADGENSIQLTLFPNEHQWLTWAPGPRLLFTGKHLTDLFIFSVEADGSQLVRLTDAVGADRGSAWSPDGTRIAFFRNSTRRSVVCRLTSPMTRLRTSTLSGLRMARRSPLLPIEMATGRST